MINLFKKLSLTDILTELNKKKFEETKINKILKDININQKFNDGENFLHKVIPHNNIESVRALIAHRISINQANIYGDTALIIAARYHYPDTIETLINANADISLTNDDNRLAIQEAIAQNNFQGYKILSKHQKDFNHRDNNGNTLLHDAIYAGNMDILNDLLENKNIVPEYSIIFCKGLYKDFSILQKVLNYFDNINMVDDNNQNLLFYLAKDGYESYDSLQYILKKDIDINCINKDGDTVIMYLIKYIIKISREYEIEPEEEKNLLELIPVLIEEGVDLSICNNDDENVLTIATKALNKEIVTILMEYDCDPNLSTQKKENALAIACMMGNRALDIMYLLLDYGASPNLGDIEGKTIIEKLIDIELFKKSGKKLKASERRLVNEKNDYFVILESVLTNAETQLTRLNSK